jgi:phospholipid N-methyltransferase
MLKFFEQTLKHFRTTGAISPSSGELSRLLVYTGNIKNARCIVEFGPGTGVATKYILQAKNPETVFFAIEMNPYFAEITRKNCPDAIVYCDNAINLKTYLEKHHQPSCDIIYSGLPWSLIDDRIQDKLLDVIYDNLNENGEFITFAYIHSIYLPNGKKFRKKIEERFKSVQKTRTVWLNTPPAFVYHAKK